MSSLMGTSDFDGLFKTIFNFNTQKILFYGIKPRKKNYRRYTGCFSFKPYFCKKINFYVSIFVKLSLELTLYAVENLLMFLNFLFNSTGIIT